MEAPMTKLDRMQAADRALKLCRSDGKTTDPDMKVLMQANAVYTVSQLQRADMRVFADALGMTYNDFSQCIWLARRIMRTGSAPYRQGMTPVERMVRDRVTRIHSLKQEVQAVK